MLACRGCLVSSAAAAAVPCSTSARWSGVSCISSRLAGATGADLGGGGLCGTAARIGVGVSQRSNFCGGAESAATHHQTSP